MVLIRHSTFLVTIRLGERHEQKSHKEQHREGCHGGRDAHEMKTLFQTISSELPLFATVASGEALHQESEDAKSQSHHAGSIRPFVDMNESKYCSSYTNHTSEKGRLKEKLRHLRLLEEIVVAFNDSVEDVSAKEAAGAIKAKVERAERQKGEFKVHGGVFLFSTTEIEGCAFFMREYTTVDVCEPTDTVVDASYRDQPRFASSSAESTIL